MNYKILTTFCSVPLLLACSAENGGDNPGGNRTPATVPVEFYISVPKTDATRIGDPGSSTGEDVDWDRITVILAYKQKNTGVDDFDASPNKMVYWSTFTRSDFESTNEVFNSSATLSPVYNGSTDTGVRTFTMALPAGVVRAYGITYSSPNEDANSKYANYLVDFEQRLSSIKEDGADHNDDILAWTIPNSYATTDGTVSTMNVAKFISVATGYGVNANAPQTPCDLTIEKANDITSKQQWSMTLHRLATKIDMQWDAQPAYDASAKKYVNVAIDAFAYDGGAANPKNAPLGDGLVFPYKELFSTGKTFEALGGTAQFYNTSPISKRNGRVYHYIFPDLHDNTSSSPARINFTITTKTTNADGSTSEEKSQSWSFNFSKVAQILPATWYKLNVKIKGNDSKETDIAINSFNTGN